MLKRSKITMPINRQQTADLLLTSALIGAGFLTGGPIIQGIAGVVGGIGVNWASNLTRSAWEAACGRLLSPSGLGNPDLQQAMVRALDQAIRRLEQGWGHTSRGSQIRRNPAECESVAAVFKLLRDDATDFFQPDNMGRISGNARVQQLLYGDEAAVDTSFAENLRIYLHGHDQQLTNFLEKNLMNELAFCFAEELKTDRPVNNRAWRAFQRLLLESLRAGVAQIQAGQQEIRQALIELQSWVDRMDSRPLEQREPTGQAELEQTLSSLSSQITTGFQQVQEGLDGVPERIRPVVREEIRASGFVTPATDLTPAPGQPPYKGLQSFSEDDAEDFFGRETLTAVLVAQLREHSLLVVVGASGSGKSSLVQAGLVPALRRGLPLADGTLLPERSASWDIRIITPTAQPVNKLATCLIGDSRQSEAERKGLREKLQRSECGLRDHMDGLLSQTGAGDRLLLVVDQFEEVFTLCRDKDQRRIFVDNLLSAARPRLGSEYTVVNTTASVVLVLRVDFYSYCAEFDQLWAALGHYQRNIGPMTQAELRRAVEKPALKGGWAFDDGLEDVLLKDVGAEPGALPLLSHALRETWERRQGRRLTLSGYMASGRVQGAIAQTADEVYQHSLTSEQQPIAKTIFLELTELGEGTLETRRRVPLSTMIPQNEKGAAVEAVLRILADRRLVTIFEDQVEVAHEALIREWPMLQKWLDNDREDLRLHRRLAEAADEWEKKGRDHSYLWGGNRLTGAEEWAGTRSSDLRTLEREFLSSSVSRRNSEEKARRSEKERELNNARARAERESHTAGQLRKLTTYLMVALAIAVIAAVGTVAFFMRARDAQNKEATARQMAEAEKARAVESAQEAREKQAQAEFQGRRSRAGEMAARAQNAVALYPNDPSLALLLAREAILTTWQQDGYVTPDAAQAAVEAVQSAPPWLMNWPQRRHAGAVNSICFSPDGEHILTASDDQTARVWDAQTGRELMQLVGHEGPVSDARFSSDGQRIVTGGKDGTTRVWDAQTGHEVRLLAGHAGSVESVAFSSDGRRILTTSEDKTARLWDANTGDELLVFPDHSHAVVAAAFSPDNRLLVTASYAPGDVELLVWDTETGKRLLRLAGDGSPLYSLAFSLDGRRIVAAMGALINIWDSQTGEQVFGSSLGCGTDSSILVKPMSDGLSFVSFDERAAKLTWSQCAGSWPDTGCSCSGRGGVEVAGFGWGPLLAAFSPDARYIAAVTKSDGTFRVWDTQTERQVFQPDDHHNLCSGTRVDLVFSPNGQFIANVAGDHTVRVWDARTGQELRRLVLLSSPSIVSRSYTTCLTSVAFSLDGQRILTSAGNGTIVVWDANTGRELLRLGPHADRAEAAAFSPDGERIVAARGDHVARVWDAHTGQQVQALIGHGGNVNSAVYSRDGRLILTASDDRTARLWDADTGQEKLQLRGHADSVNSAVFGQDGDRILTASDDGTVRLWDAHTGQELMRFAEQPKAVLSAMYDPDEQRIVTACEDGIARVWNISTGEELLRLRGHGARAATFSPDGQYIATVGDDGLVKLWNGRTGPKMLRAFPTLLGHKTAVMSATFSPDGQCILTAGFDRTARVWDASTGQQLSLLGDESDIELATYSPDGRRVLTASSDGTARVWDASTGKRLVLIDLSDLWSHVSSPSIGNAAYSPDGEYVAFRGEEHRIRVWETRTWQETQVPPGVEGWFQTRVGSVYVKYESDLIGSAALSPDGKSTVTASEDHVVQLRDSQSGEVVLSFADHGGVILSAGMSPDGRSVVTAGEDGVVQLRDSQSGEVVLSFAGLAGAIDSVEFSPDGNYLITAGQDGTVRVWPGNVEILLQQVNSHIRARPSIVNSKGMETARSGATGTDWKTVEIDTLSGTSPERCVV